jgi:hypothetical protein
MTEGVARVLYTADGEEVKVYDAGGDRILSAESLNTVMLLQDIKTELRILNMHMQQLTELDLDGEDLEEEGIL